jgi:hypothetical protein
MFTDVDKESIRRWLGYPAEASWLTLIDQRCNDAYAASPAVVQTVRSHLRELARIDQEIKSSRPFADRTLTSNASGTSQRSPSFGREYYQQQIRSLVDSIAQTLRLVVRSYPQAASSGWSSTGKLRRA